MVASGKIKRQVILSADTFHIINVYIAYI
eukprot:COSAG06_NODE_62223_length_265_cov_1.240964_1_plen_28_part_10